MRIKARNGRGLDDLFIDYLPSLMNDPLQFYSFFISHSSGDNEFAKKLENDLQAQSVRCWFDEKALLPGDDILFEIDKGIKIADSGRILEEFGFEKAQTRRPKARTRPCCGQKRKVVRADLVETYTLEAQASQGPSPSDPPESRKTG